MPPHTLQKSIPGPPILGDVGGERYQAFRIFTLDPFVLHGLTPLKTNACLAERACVREEQEEQLSGKQVFALTAFEGVSSYKPNKAASAEYGDSNRQQQETVQALTRFISLQP